MRFAYADPPYPGQAARYYAGHADFAGEVDHGELAARLVLEYPDGWALSTSARALPDVLALCPAGVRVGVWVRGARPTVSAWPLSAWEAVVFVGGRRLPSRDVVDDVLVYTARPRLSDPGRVVGAKPARFCYWLFDLLGARGGDELVDLFPGSSGVARAWAVFASRSIEPRRVDAGDTSAAALADASAEGLADECQEAA